MCGRFAVVIPKKYQAYITDVDLSFLADTPQYNVAPGQSITTIVKPPQDKKAKATKMKWDFKPLFAKDFNHELINVRSETVDSKPLFKYSFLSNRCLIPASGYYEWKKEGTKKIPYYFHVTTQPVFAFAGIYTWLGEEKSLDNAGVAILTCQANPVVSKIHDRMPVILGHDYMDTWLDSKTDQALLKKILTSYTGENFHYYAVSLAVNSARSQGEELIRPLETLI
jgi:putative SOS response-associated peptidase YedK